MTQGFPVNPKVLKWAREQAGYSIEEIEKLYKKYAEWESELSLPSYPQLETLATKYKIPIAVFFFPNPPSIEPIEKSLRAVSIEEIYNLSPPYQILIQESDRLVSVSEVLHEINDKKETLKSWAEDKKTIFERPTPEEGKFVRKIFKVNNGHFQHNIKRQNILTGAHVADPFIVARAKALSGTLITEEQYQPNGAKVPNICDHFGISGCFNLQGLMEAEG